MTEVNDKQSQPGREVWRHGVMLVALLAAAAGLRSVAIAARWDQLSLDPDAYRLIAENLRLHGIYSRSQVGEPVVPTAFRPPLYPVLLAALTWHGHVTPLAVAALHIVLGTLSVLLAWILARKWELGQWSGLVALMVACDPILLNQATEVMTETLATFFAIAGLLALTQLGQARSWKSGLLVGLMVGLVLGLASLCRPTFLVWVALLVAWSIVFRRSMGMMPLMAMLFGFLLILTPWVLRNQRVMGRAIVATTHGGYTLLLGNNPAFFHHLRTGKWGSVWDARELLPLLESAEGSVAKEADADRKGDTGQVDPMHPELVSDRQLYELAGETIRDDPTTFAWASLVRLARFWTPLPHQLRDDESWQRTVGRWAVALWYCSVCGISLVGLWLRGGQNFAPPWVWGLLCVVALVLVHTFYWSNMRMRAPAMPMVYLAFTYGCRGIWEKAACCKSF